LPDTREHPAHGMISARRMRVRFALEAQIRVLEARAPH
jgi:hypothetical protein